MLLNGLGTENDPNPEPLQSGSLNPMINESH
jgi:hypothetical protein